MSVLDKARSAGHRDTLVADGTEAKAADWFDWSRAAHADRHDDHLYLIIGLVFFALSDWLVERVLPRSLRKGIEEDKNVALAIVIAAVILGVAMIVAAAIRG